MWLFLQGDSFLPVLYIMCLLPLTMILCKCSSGYLLGDKHVLVNHLLYLDDLKLYGRNQWEILSLVTTVKMFSDDICMQFGLDKCASLSIRWGKVQAVVTPQIRYHITNSTVQRHRHPIDAVLYCSYSQYLVLCSHHLSLSWYHKSTIHQPLKSKIK